ncbi:MAG: type 1 glutamine amidotransferase [Chloroflexi bacterium]|nr:type 1 glutamine amidotransferase [Chloroflexota bacterium]
MNQKRILILDYSTDRSEAPAIRQWLPEDAQITSLFIDTKDSFPDDLVGRGFTHVIHSGSALSINNEAPFTKRAITFIRAARDKGIAQMGICYGHQLIALALVGKEAVRSSPNGFEAGWGAVSFNEKALGLFGIRESEILWQHHFDEVIALPNGSKLLASNPHTKIQAYLNDRQRLFGTQFHPEFDRKIGNTIYMKDRKLLAKNNYDVDEIIKGGPSIEAGKIFFGFFLKNI